MTTPNTKFRDGGFTFVGCFPFNAGMSKPDTFICPDCRQQFAFANSTPKGGLCAACAWVADGRPEPDTDPQVGTCDLCGKGNVPLCPQCELCEGCCDVNFGDHDNDGLTERERLGEN